MVALSTWTGLGSAAPWFGSVFLACVCFTAWHARCMQTSNRVHEYCPSCAMLPTSVHDANEVVDVHLRCQMTARFRSHAWITCVKTHICLHSSKIFAANMAKRRTSRLPAWPPSMKCSRFLSTPPCSEHTVCPVLRIVVVKPSDKSRPGCHKTLISQRMCRMRGYLGCRQLEGPQEVGGCLEVGAHCEDLVHQVLNADDVVLAQRLWQQT